MFDIWINSGTALLYLGRLCRSILLSLSNRTAKDRLRFKRRTSHVPNPWIVIYTVDKAIHCLNNRSLRADEIKLWLTPSAKQRRNPCSGLPAVYPDLSTHHDWPVKKDLCFVCRKTGNSQSGWREIRNALPVIRWVGSGSITRISALLRRRH